ncbi:MAG: hypothetical protein PUF72_02260 [Clostridiales bacterium]|nr:hypothetical protein [Clostridiales bacterium]
MIKKFISVISAISMLAAAAALPQIASAAVESDTVIYDYDYTQYTSADEVKAKGITITGSSSGYSYGTPTNANNVCDAKGVWWLFSTKKASTDSTDIEMVNIDFTSGDTQNTLAQVSDSVIMAELDYGAIFQGAASNLTEQMQLRFIGKDSNGNDAKMATFVMLAYGKSVNGKCYFQGTDPETKYTAYTGSGSSAQPAQRTYLQIFFDLRTQTYTAYVQKKATFNGSTSTTLNEPKQLLVENIPFQCGTGTVVKSPKNLSITARLFAQYDKFQPISMKLTALAPTTTYTDAEEVSPELADGETQYAAGFTGTFNPLTDSSKMGFKLTYGDTKTKDISFDSSALKGNVKAGIILTWTDEDNFDKSLLKVQSYITE